MLTRLGIQKRIMAYVIVGLLLMFGAFFYLGMQAVDRSTDLVFKERLSIAQSVAAALGRDFDQVVRHTMDETEGLSPGSDGVILEAASMNALHQLSVVDNFSFFKVVTVSLLDANGRLLSIAPPDPTRINRQAIPASYSTATTTDTGPRVFHPEGASPGEFVSFSIPLKNAEKGVWAWALVETEGNNSPQSFVPFGLIGPSRRDEPAQPSVPRQAEYDLEVHSPAGNTILAIGSDHDVGNPSWHHPLIKDLIERGQSGVMVHEVKHVEGARDHVMAAVPVPLSDVHLILEQDKDVALALPNDFRNKLMIFGGSGFVLAILGAWVTTRHVVKPTEKLTAAAGRMAQGELSAPIQVRAQDEIGDLATALDTMRQKLNEAHQRIESTNRELESQVRERTARLGEVLRKVISAQEEERYRLARELHDETAQTLGALSIALDRARDRLQVEEPETELHLLEAKTIAASLLEETRRLILDLRPQALDDLGLGSAVRLYAETHLEEQGVAITVEMNLPAARLPKHIEVSLFRIIQEAINNIAKHAEARNARIRLALRDSVVSAVVTDDGKGFNVDRVLDPREHTESVGLLGMRERVGLLNGTIHIRSREGEGTAVSVEIPVTEDPS